MEYFLRLLLQTLISIVNKTIYLPYSFKLERKTKIMFKNPIFTYTRIKIIQILGLLSSSPPDRNQTSRHFKKGLFVYHNPRQTREVTQFQEENCPRPLVNKKEEMERRKRQRKMSFVNSSMGNIAELSSWGKYCHCQCRWKG